MLEKLVQEELKQGTEKAQCGADRRHSAIDSERLLVKYPIAISHIVTCSLVTKLRNRSGGLPQKQAVSTIALTPADRNVPLDCFAAQLVASFARMGKTVLLSSNCVERLLGREGAAQATVDHGGHVAITSPPGVCGWGPAVAA